MEDEAGEEAEEEEEYDQWLETEDEGAVEVAGEEKEKAGRVMQAGMPPPSPRDSELSLVHLRKGGVQRLRRRHAQRVVAAVCSHYLQRPEPGHPLWAACAVLRVRQARRWPT